jgi:hypothetical protein
MTRKWLAGVKAVFQTVIFTGFSWCKDNALKTPLLGRGFITRVGLPRE